MHLREMPVVSLTGEPVVGQLCPPTCLLASLLFPLPRMASPDNDGQRGLSCYLLRFVSSACSDDSSNDGLLTEFSADDRTRSRFRIGSLFVKDSIIFRWEKIDKDTRLCGEKIGFIYSEKLATKGKKVRSHKDFPPIYTLT